MSVWQDTRRSIFIQPLVIAIILLGVVAVLLISGCGEAEQAPPEGRLTSADFEIYLTNKVNTTVNKPNAERR